MTSSAYQAIKCLRILAESNPSCNSSRIITENSYVDDFLFSADTPDEAVSLAKELDSFLTAGGFPLRKWSANDVSLLSHIPDEWLANIGNNSKVLSKEHKLLGLV